MRIFGDTTALQSRSKFPLNTILAWSGCVQVLSPCLYFNSPLSSTFWHTLLLYYNVPYFVRALRSVKCSRYSTLQTVPPRFPRARGVALPSWPCTGIRMDRELLANIRSCENARSGLERAAKRARRTQSVCLAHSALVWQSTCMHPRKVASRFSSQSEGCVCCI